ncbi:hypothetical protein [Methanobrevibacter sp.]|uniref:hypothetical protein n=1 Tax=Methanobrevibacter sp. TaxID=66852 RepID=UPI0038633635
MLAPQNKEFTVLDSIESTQSAWYDEIDSAIKRSDIIPGDYEYTSATSYGNTGDIEEGASTYVDLAPPRFKIISLDNSYIELEQEIPISFDKAMDGNKLSKMWYIGYKYAPECIGAYRIHTNTDLLQTVNHANYEWFMIQNSVADSVKEKDECYATLDKIRRMDPNVPGVYVDLSAYNSANVPYIIKMKLKVPVSSFLIFYNLKYFAEWMGKICIEIFPTYRNLVIAPVIDPVLDLDKTINYSTTASAAHNIKLRALLDAKPELNLGFYNVNQEMWNFIDTTATAATTPAIDKLKCTVNPGSKATKIQIRTAQYMLQADIYDAIAQRYMTRPLVFPIQEIESKDFTQNLKAANAAASDINEAMTVALKHCDAAFTVFKRDIHSTTCFENPDLEHITFNINGKFYPREDVNTLDDVRSRNLTQDALNTNRSLITQIPKDLHTSIQPYTTYMKFGTGPLQKRYTDGDRSNYMLGLPFADSDDFMGGISTANATVQIQMTGKTKGATGYNNHLSFSQPTMIMTQDCLLKIWSFKSATRKQIEITHETIEQLALTV